MEGDDDDMVTGDGTWRRDIMQQCTRVNRASQAGECSILTLLHMYMMFVSILGVKEMMNLYVFIIHLVIASL